MSVGGLRLLRATLPPAWRDGLFDPSYAEAHEAACAGRRLRSLSFRLEVVRLWLQCWAVGLRASLRRPVDRLRGRRTSYLPPPPPESRDSMDSLFQDFRAAFRSLSTSPGFVLVAVLTLALGTGVNTAIFGVVDAMMLRPLAGTTDGEDLVFVMSRTQQTPFLLGLSYPNYEDIRDEVDELDGLLAYTFQQVSLITPSGAAERTYAHAVSANYFDVLGVPMHLGRGFRPEEGRIDTPAPVVVLDHRYWRSRLGGDPDVVGATLELNGVPFTVVGVADEAYLGAEQMLGTDLYLPIGGMVALDANTAWLSARGAGVFRTMGRLAEGVGLTAAQEALDATAERLEREHPDANRGATLVATPERSSRPDPSVGGQFAGVAAIFVVLVTLVLTIACANLANLMLARSTGRSREIAVRSALGASRVRVIRQLSAESVLLGLAGGAVGLLVAWWSVATLRAVVTSWQIELPLRLPVQIDARAVGFGLAVAIVAGFLAGLVPALRATAGDLTRALNEGARGASEGRARQRLRAVLVVGQVAVSVVLLIAAGLFVRSLQNARGAALGFEPDGRLLVSFDPTLVSMEPRDGLQLYRDVLERARALPGVAAVGLTNAPPFSPRMMMTEIRTEESAAADETRGPLTAYFSVMPGYLEAAGTRLLAGRPIAPSDTLESPPVAVINQAAADYLWPGQDPLGRRLVVESGAVFEIVGVVEQGKYLLIWEESMPALYLPMEQAYRGTASLLVHTSGDPLAQVGAIRGVIEGLAPTLPIYGVMTVADHLRDGRALMLVRLGSGLVGAFGILGILLATVGLYGVIAYSVTSRLREFGVRVALGAAPGSVLRMVVRQAFTLAAAGALLGLLLSVGVGRMMASLLIGVGPTDPTTFAAGVLLVIVTAAVASLVPAWRATRVDPITALRHE